MYAKLKEPKIKFVKLANSVDLDELAHTGCCLRCILMQNFEIIYFLVHLEHPAYSKPS